MVNVYREKENIDKEYGREGVWWVGVNNEKIGESNSRKYNMHWLLSHWLFNENCDSIEF